MTLALPKNQNAFIPTAVPIPVRTATRAALSTVVPRKSRATEANYLAHDARNWLTVLQVYCDLLRTSGAVARGYEKWIEELSSAVERGQGLVASLLDSVESADPVPGRCQPTHETARPAGSPDRRWPATTVIPSAAEPLDVAAAVTRRLPLLQRLAGGKIHVEIDVPANAGKIALSESAFERILHNLVANAIEAMPQGGHLRIALRRGNRGSGSERGSRPAARSANVSGKALKPKSLKRGDRRSDRTSGIPASKTLLLRVHDSGGGIAPERLSRIFEAGFSGKGTPEDDRRSRGFGLAIVRELTQEAGGAVRVRSHPGRGTCFEVELPRI